MNLNKTLITSAICLLAAGNAFADAGKAYVSSQDGGVTIVDLESMAATGTIDVKGDGPRGLAVTDDGKFLIVATRENGSISIVDTATNEVVKQVKVGMNPEFVRVKGNFAFVSYEPSAKGGPPPVPGSAEALKAAAEEDDDDKEPARIGIIDLIKGKKIREITGGPETEGIEFSKDGKQLIITNEADNTITAVSYTHLDVYKRQLPRITPMRLGAGLRYQLNGIGARLDVLHAFGQNRTAPSELKTDGYTDVSAMVRYKLPAKFNVELFAKAKNLLNQEIREHASFLKDISPAGERSLLFGLRADF